MRQKETLKTFWGEPPVVAKLTFHDVDQLGPRNADDGGVRCHLGDISCRSLYVKDMLQYGVREDTLKAISEVGAERLFEIEFDGIRIDSRTISNPGFSTTTKLLASGVSSIIIEPSPIE